MNKPQCVADESITGNNNNNNNNKTDSTTDAIAIAPTHTHTHTHITQFSPQSNPAQQDTVRVRVRQKKGWRDTRCYALKQRSINEWLKNKVDKKH